MTGPENDTYILGRSADETERLIRQAERSRTTSRRFLEDAGVGPGMKVLDIGTGAGDVAMLASEMVGRAGQIIGMDMNSAILETARKRAEEAGFAHVTFVSGRVPDDLGSLDNDFDAIVGRRVAMFFPDAAGTLRQLAAHLKHGGIMAFLEIDLTAIGQHTFPRSILGEQVSGWIVQASNGSSLDGNMGTNLYRTFLDAGMPAQESVGIVEVGGPEAIEALLGLVRTLRDQMLRFGIATEAELDIDSLRSKLVVEAARDRTFRLGPLMVAAWSRKP
jgi:2-polyprenyl-3-methyl-5-hydroxy-6-metoxy-1,4-benzoquinol methylase